MFPIRDGFPGQRRSQRPRIERRRPPRQPAVVADAPGPEPPVRTRGSGCNVFDRSDDPAVPAAGGVVEADWPQPEDPARPPVQQLRSLLEVVATAEPTLVDVLRYLAEQAAEGLPAAEGILVAVRRHDGSREV